MQIAQRLAPEIPAVYLTSGYLQDDTLGIGKAERSKWTGAFNVNDYGGSVPKAIKAAGGKFWSPDSRDLDPAQVKEALEAGIGVTVWTVNDQAEMARIIDMGVDGIITDYPEILRQVLVERGRAVPTPVPGAALCKAAATSRGPFVPVEVLDSAPNWSLPRDAQPPTPAKAGRSRQWYALEE